MGTWYLTKLIYFIYKMKESIINNEVLNAIAIMLQNELKVVSPVDTGRLRSSINVKSTDRGLLISMVGYGKNVEFGTPPHAISPEELKGWSKRKLKDENLAYSVAEKIMRYGTRPNPFIRNTLSLKFPQIVKEAIKENIKK